MVTGLAEDFRQVAVVTNYELYKYIRNKRMYIFIGLAALMIILITLVTAFGGSGFSSKPNDFVSNYIGFINLLIILGAALFSSSAVASEFEERTALLLFPRPIRKISIFLGKVVSSFLFCGGVILVYYIIVGLMCFIITGGMPTNYLGSLAMAELFVLACSGIAFLMSSIVTRGSIAAILTFAYLFLITNIVDAILQSILKFEPWFEMVYASGAISNIIVGKVTTTIPFPGGEMIMFYPDNMIAAVVMFAWFAVTMAVSYWLFTRREF